MPKLFHLECSPRADSESAASARVFLDGFRKVRPDWDVDMMNPWRDHLPEFEGHVLEAKYARMNGRAFTDPQRDAFAAAERIAVRLALADRVLISTPMWNFSIPYKLKQWFDVIIQPGLTFRFDPSAGYQPLLKDKPRAYVGGTVTGAQVLSTLHKRDFVYAIDIAPSGDHAAFTHLAPKVYRLDLFGGSDLTHLPDPPPNLGDPEICSNEWDPEGLAF